MTTETSRDKVIDEVRTRISELLDAYAITVPEFKEISEGLIAEYEDAEDVENR